MQLEEVGGDTVDDARGDASRSVSVVVAKQLFRI